MLMNKKKIYNLSESAAKLGLSSEVLKKLLTRSYPGFFAEVDILKNAVVKRDYKQLKETAHKLKGSFGNYLLETAYECVVIINDNSEELKDYPYRKKIDEIEEYLSDVMKELNLEIGNG
jgi:HPt (histidine-containing phosphotransfer) domain-containing protein